MGVINKFIVAVAFHVMSGHEQDDVNIAFLQEAEELRDRCDDASHDRGRCLWRFFAIKFDDAARCAGYLLGNDLYTDVLQEYCKRHPELRMPKICLITDFRVPKYELKTWSAVFPSPLPRHWGRVPEHVADCCGTFRGECAVKNMIEEASPKERVLLLEGLGKYLGLPFDV